MRELLQHRFNQLLPPVDFCALRYVAERSEKLIVRQDIAEPPQRWIDAGVMISVMHNGGLGYAATSDLSETGLKRAIQQACDWAECTRGRLVTGLDSVVMSHQQGEYHSPVGQAWETLNLQEKYALLQEESQHCKIDERIVDWEAELWSVNTEQLYLTNQGGHVYQTTHLIIPNISVTANAGMDTQRRSFGGQVFARQGGLEVLAEMGFHRSGHRLAEEALQLLTAPNCPTDTRDVLLMPDQMVLQIHESIGHPLELDRILGDERNYAGTSFVTQEMFGHYQYGSSLLNVTYNPTVRGEFASFCYDDEGLAADKTYLIREGILINPLGSTSSQARAQMSGVANARASSWNRPPIDRMANINLETGDSSLADMIARTERGILMQSNVSWSIDDSRNKFQFGCEWGQLIDNGQLTDVVKNPNYRGISATFWRNLQAVGNADTFQVLGVPYCGKGEPNQLIRVGHATPACLFSNIDVFGGA
ncbi:TldD/PmbA family protein [Beggiatoa leptomitoformis]|uniref:TldD/PmbA family protein n=1 Tax=Beggiatoa leptomitoformis TaxID=288004 RepID=A0A2N9YAW2_9GAMM|nr:TldD/PmbA family protein [Beggiatoa leptomitoformis]ALG67017.1 TldD/PmbA family protein [Beggiatoa leptomitoformis]AUI67606.1 TldD/PmbA family protein [Beggiatoa leptomitoformis]